MYSDAANPTLSGTPDVPPPDLAASTEDYARRFAGSVGAWMLSVQTATILDMLSPLGVRRVLDVGGGHAQTTPPMLDAGYEVTTLVSSPAAGERLARVSGDAAAITVGDVEVLPMADRSVDAVVSVRMMAHVADWQRFVAELARVADKAVVIDFALATSGTDESGFRYKIKRMIEGNTRPYETQSLEDVTAAFGAAGYKVERIYGQFTLPMVLHRTLKVPAISKLLEKVARSVFGKTGNPVLLLATRS